LRLDVQPRVSAELGLGQALRIRPYGWYRQDLYLGEWSKRFGQRGYPLAGVQLQTELSRTFGEKTLLRHAIRPTAELRFVPAIFGSAAGDYDELDAAVNTHRGGVQAGFMHGLVEVQQRLLTRAGTGPVRELARLDLAQSLDLGYQSRRRLGDTSARLLVALDRVNLDTIARYNFDEDRLTQLTLRAMVSDALGNHAYVRYDNLVVDGADRQRQGIDTLTGPPSLISSPGKRNDTATRAQLVVAGGKYKFPFGLGVRYEVMVAPSFELPAAKGLRDAFLPSPLAQQVAGVSYGPACDCWRLEAYAVMRRDTDVPDFGVNLSLSRFGTFGSGG